MEHNEAVEAMQLQGASASAIDEKELELMQNSLPMYTELISELQKECTDIMEAFLIGVKVGEKI